MTAAGWIFMMLSLAFVVTLTGYCYTRVLRSKPSQKPESSGPGAADPNERP